jgi:hypothetical protein
MSDASIHPDLDTTEKLWKVINLQADTALKQAQTRYEPWKMIISAMAAGGALVGGTVALMKVLGV